MYYINNSGKSLWWDLALEWLLEDDPELAMRLMREGRLVAYLDEREGMASEAFDACASGNAPEEALAEHLLSVFLPEAEEPSRARVEYTCSRTGGDDDFNALIGEVLRASQDSSGTRV